MKLLVVHYMPSKTVDLHLENFANGQELNLWAFMPFWARVADNNPHTVLDIRVLFGEGLRTEVEKAMGEGPLQGLSTSQQYYISDNDVVTLRSTNLRAEDSRAIQSKVFYDSFRPDVVVHRMPEPWARTLLPSAQPFFMEVGPINRFPYRSTLFMDPIGYGGESLLASMPSKIIECGGTLPNLLHEVRSRYTQDFVRHGGADAQFIDQLKQNYHNVLLFAVQYESFFYSPYTRHLDIESLLADTLQYVPEDTALVFCPRVHNRPDNGLSEDQMRALQAQYKNLILVPDGVRRPYFTQMLVPYVDGVVAVTSTVGQQSVLWGKHWFTSPESYYRQYTPTYEQIAGTMSGAPVQGAQTLLNWMLHRYAFPASLMLQPGAIGTYFASVLQHINSLDSSESPYFDKVGFFPAQDLLDQYVNN